MITFEFAGKDYKVAGGMNGKLIPLSKKKEVEKIVDNYIYGKGSEYTIWPLIQQGYLQIT